MPKKTNLDLVQESIEDLKSHEPEKKQETQHLMDQLAKLKEAREEGNRIF